MYCNPRRGENSPGQKSKNFLANPAPARKIFDFFLPMAKNRLIFARNLYIFARNLYILVRNLYILARICTFWRDKTGPRKEKFDFFLANPARVRINFDFFLANPTPARINSKKISSPGCSLSQISPPWRGLPNTTPFHPAHTISKAQRIQRI